MLNKNMKMNSATNQGKVAMKPRAFRPNRTSYQPCDDYVKDLYHMYKDSLDRSTKVLTSSQSQSSQAYQRATKNIQMVVPLINHLVQRYDPRALTQ